MPYNAAGTWVEPTPVPHSELSVNTVQLLNRMITVAEALGAKILAWEAARKEWEAKVGEIVAQVLAGTIAVPEEATKPRVDVGYGRGIALSWTVDGKTAEGLFGKGPVRPVYMDYLPQLRSDITYLEMTDVEAISPSTAGGRFGKYFPGVTPEFESHLS